MLFQSAPFSLSFLSLLFCRAMSSSSSSSSSSSLCSGEERLYKIQPLTKTGFGGVVTDFSFNGSDEPLSSQMVQQLKDDVKNYRLVLFKKQGKLSGSRQVQISKHLGRVESTFYKHPRSPHPDIFRVSNEESEGCVGVGRTGWHVDGTFQGSPFKYQTMHFHSVCPGGDTWFVPLKEFYELQDDETKERWNQLWMVAGRREGYVHPLVYQHPIRGDTSMIFHCGGPFCAGFIQEEEKEEEDPSSSPKRTMLPAERLQDEIGRKLDAVVDKIGVRLGWEEGDFAITDNLGIAHYAAPGTQQSSSKVGLRILHRTTVAGETIPQKLSGEKSYLLG